MTTTDSQNFREIQEINLKFCIFLVTFDMEYPYLENGLADFTDFGLIFQDFDDLSDEINLFRRCSSPLKLPNIIPFANVFEKSYETLVRRVSSRSKNIRKRKTSRRVHLFLMFSIHDETLELVFHILHEKLTLVPVLFSSGGGGHFVVQANTLGELKL